MLLQITYIKYPHSDSRLFLHHHYSYMSLTLISNYIMLAISTGLMRLAVFLPPCKTQAVGHLVEDVNVIIGATECLLAGAHSKYGHVSQRVYT